MTRKVSGTRLAPDDLPRHRAGPRVLVAAQTTSAGLPGLLGRVVAAYPTASATATSSTMSPSTVVEWSAGDSGSISRFGSASALAPVLTTR
jgi:hypothetical protein